MAVNPSIQLGTDGNWAIKEDNLLAYKKLGSRFFNREFDFSRGTTATFVGENGLIQESFLTGTELVTNGDFATDSDWTKGSGVTISDGEALITVTNGGYQSLGQSVTYISGKSYTLTASVNGTIGKGCTFFDASGNNGGLNTSNGVVTFNGEKQYISFDFIANNNSNTVLIARNGTGNYSFTIDNVSVKEIQLDVPRIDFTDDPTGHLLLEPQSTNLLTYSEDFNQWSKLNGGTGSLPIVTSNNSTSPDGTQNADKIIFNKGNATSNSDYSLIRLDYGGSDINGTSSVYLKSDVNIDIEISSDDISYKTISVTTNWNRFEVSDATSDRLSMGLRGTEPSNSSATIYAWGAQLEQLSYATSYIPTSGSAVTRNQDICNNSGTASDFNSEEGVIYAEIAALASSDTNNPIRGISISSGSTNNTIFIYYQAVLNRLSCIVISNGTTQFSNSTELFNVADYLKIALKYKQNDFALWVNGVEVVTDTVGNAPIGLSELAFDNGVGNDKFYGKTKNIQVFKRALTDAELYLLTVTQYESYQEMATALNYTL